MGSFMRKIFCLGLLVIASSSCTSRERTPANAGPTGLAATFSYRLVKLDHGILQPIDTASLNNIKYFAFYYSASWCPPCRIFTPKLVDFYNSFKPQHPDFELIFVNQGSSASDMLDYMKAEAMPWPAARFEDIDGSNANQYASEEIPDLVLVDADGKVLSNSFMGSTYVGPNKVLDDIQSLVH